MAALLQVVSSQSQPFSLAHLRMSRCPLAAALPQVDLFFGMYGEGFRRGGVGGSGICMPASRCFFHCLHASQLFRRGVYTKTKIHERVL